MSGEEGGEVANKYYRIPSKKWLKPFWAIHGDPRMMS